MMDFILSYSLKVDDLKNYVAHYPNSPLICTALFQLGSRESQAGQPTGAQEHLNQFVQQCPQHESVGSAQLLLQSLQNYPQANSWKVGVLIPKTGRYKGLGLSALNGIMMALEQANLSGGSRKPTSLVVRDTAGNAIQAVKEFQDLCKDNTLDAVIGPMVPAEIAAVAPLACQQHITLITPSVSPEDMYSLGPIFQQQYDQRGTGKGHGPIRRQPPGVQALRHPGPR